LCEQIHPDIGHCEQRSGRKEVPERGDPRRQKTRQAPRRVDFTAIKQGPLHPEVWVADRYAAQTGHAHERQLCLAHLLRDAQYAIDSGDTGFAAGFYKLLQRAVGMGRRRAKLKDTTLAQYAPISTAGSTGWASPNTEARRFAPARWWARTRPRLGSRARTGGNGWCFRRPPSIT
jgi:hypothetical protein